MGYIPKFIHYLPSKRELYNICKKAEETQYKWSNNKELPDYVFLTKEEKISD